MIPVSQPFANPALPCNPTSLSLLFALGRSPSNSLRHNGFQLGTGSTLPAFCQNHPANPQIAGRDRLATDCLLSQTVQSLRCHFRLSENRRHSGGLGWRDAVSGHQSEGGGREKGAFLAPVSAHDFPISVSACWRPVRYGTETGSQDRTLGVERGADIKPATPEDYYCRSLMLRSCSAHEYGSALARPVTVRSAGALPSTIAAMMRGDTKARGASRRMCRSP